METLKLILQFALLILPFILNKDKIPYDSKVKLLNELLTKKRKEFARMDKNERTIALSNLFDELNRVFGLRE